MNVLYIGHIWAQKSRQLVHYKRRQLDMEIKTQKVKKSTFHQNPKHKGSPRNILISMELLYKKERV